MRHDNLLPKAEIVHRLSALMGGHTTECWRPTRLTLGVIARHLEVRRGLLYDYALKRIQMSGVMQKRLSKVLLDIERQTLVFSVVDNTGVLLTAEPLQKNLQRTASLDWSDGQPKIQWGKEL